MEKSIKKLLEAIGEFGHKSEDLDDLANILESQVIAFIKDNNIKLKDIE